MSVSSGSGRVSAEGGDTNGTDDFKVAQFNGFYAIPNCFSKKKEDAERFAKCMHPYIGNYDCIYTRNEKGRELLLEGRVKALANREERCISHKKVKGALE